MVRRSIYRIRKLTYLTFNNTILLRAHIKTYRNLVLFCRSSCSTWTPRRTCMCSFWHMLSCFLENAILFWLDILLIRCMSCKLSYLYYWWCKITTNTSHCGIFILKSVKTRQIELSSVKRKKKWSISYSYKFISSYTYIWLS